MYHPDAPRFVVIGNAQVGKTTFSRYLGHHMRIAMADTSEAVVEVEEARMANLRVVQTAANWDKDRDRPARRNLVATGDALQTLGPTVLADWCFARANIACGVRRQTELAAIREKYPDVIVIRIYRPGHPIDPEDNFDIERDSEMTCIWADTVGDLDRAARIVADNFGSE